MSRQSLSVHLSRTVRYEGKDVVLDARATIRYSTKQPPEAMLEMLRAQCRDELDGQERAVALERRGDRSLAENLEGLDRIGRGEAPTVRPPLRR